ncbi:MAG TPA: ATP-binding protein, partial [Parachlamydiaceae bacterium]|nr:ATP-binding protein [Parachlamydiaceae bacterium]
PWIAVHVDTGKTLDKVDEDTLARNIALARDLGAEVITTNGPDVAQAIQRIARQKSVTQIIIGRPPQRWFLDRFQSNTIMDHLAKECADIDLHVIRQTLMNKSFGKKWKWPRSSDPISSYLLVTGWVILLSVFSWFSLSVIDYKIIGFIFLLGIMSLSLFFRKGPIFFASILYAAIWILFFLPSKDFGMATLDEIILLAFYLLTAFFTGILTDRSKVHKEMLEKREKSLEILYDIVRDIAGASTLGEVLTTVKNGLNSTLGGHTEIVIKESDNGLVFKDSIHFSKNEKEKAASVWVFQNGKEAGWSTTTLPFAVNLYIPLKGQKEIVGVLAYHPESKKELSIEEKNFLYTVSQQLANYLERSLSEEKARKYEENKKIEKTYHSILNLISELFEGPLLTIQDAVIDLKSTSDLKKTSEIFQPVDRISSSSESLARILENISAMVNLSAGMTPVDRTLNDLKELINISSVKVQKSFGTHRWDISLDEHLPMIPFDFDLISLLFYNLVFHAVEFSLPESTIEVSAKQVGDYVEMSISGEGHNIPAEMLNVAFEKFYRAPESIPSGLGLGLAIANTIATAHHGELKIKNRPKGGMIFALYLPLR